MCPEHAENAPSPHGEPHADESSRGKADRSLSSKTPEDDVVSEIVSSIPQEERRRVHSIMMGESYSFGRLPSPIEEKLTAEHIGRLIELGDRDSERMYQDSLQGRRYSLAYALLAVLLFVFLVIFLSQANPTLLTDLVQHVVVFAGGAGLGYGYSERRRRRD